MTKRLFVAAFEEEKDLLRTVAAVRERQWPIVEAYTPYPVHGLDRALGLPRTHLSAACFFCGLLGAALALGFQFWAMDWDWPLNVGGQPWNALPAFVPVTFEAMVLVAGLGLFFAWLARCRLYPGKRAHLALPNQTDNRFVLVLAAPPMGSADEFKHLLQTSGAHSIDIRDEVGDQ
jgi:hypothetical protein